ncbi:MAG TPA: hypothetical protein VKA76_11115 [Gammaproteobacteria bacterium]|nr:hypothetical protein [Gammaproteobacteria bacterium]
MSERIFRLIIGTTLLVCLYLEPRPGAKALLFGLLAVMIFEGITNWRVPILVSRLRYGAGADVPDDGELAVHAAAPWIRFDAERAWRLVVAAMLVFTLFAFPEQLWFFPWFMGFAILGAGLSGVCPVLISLKLIGFR